MTAGLRIADQDAEAPLSSQRLGRIVAALLVLGAALFVLAVGLERGDHHDAPAGTSTVTSGEQGGHDEAAEAAQDRSDNSTQAKVESTDETVLGVNVESPGVVALGVGVALVLSALAWLKPHRAVFAIVAVLASAFAVLDVAEILHLLDRSETGLAMLAGAVALGHLLAAVASAWGAFSAPSQARPIRATGLA